MRTARRLSLLLTCALVFATPHLFGQAPAKLPAKSQTKAPSKATAGKSPSKASAGVTDPALLKPALANAKAPESYKVKFTTTQGDFTVQVTRAWAPLGADRFYNLARHHYFDGAAFFRVLTQPRPFVAQFGLNPDPKVTQAWQGAMIKDDPVVKSNTRGFLTYAAGGANTRTTQIFINFGDNSALDVRPDHFAPFGEVTEGMDVVDKFYGGYGEGAPNGNGPSQDLITQKGKAYLDASFPKLDKILTTAVEAPPQAAASDKAPAKTPAKSTSKAPVKKAPAKQPS